jgi:hypothetical protein
MSEPVSPPAIASLDDDQAWYVATRWQQLDGEYRANYLRTLSVVTFYGIHLTHHYQPLGVLSAAVAPDQMFHAAATLIATGWLVMALAIELSLRQHLFPAWLPYLTTAADLVLLTSLLALGGGQQSPLVLGYLLIVVLAAVRFHLRLIRGAAAGSLSAYLFLMAMGRWPGWFGGWQIGVIPRYAQLMTLLAIGITGIMLGQLVRRARVTARYYAQRRRGA